MGDANRDAPQVHNYPESRTAMTYLGMPALSLFGLWVGVFGIREGDVPFAIIWILVAIWFGLLSVFAAFMCSSITMSDEAIAASNFGRTLKRIRWADVTRVKKVRRWNLASRSFEDSFYVYDDTFSALRERMVNSLGPIVFTDKIDDLRSILDRVNLNAGKYQFPLAVLDEQAARAAASKQGAATFGVILRGAEEVRVTAL